MESVGEVMRDWRKRRRVSQLELASDASVSSRHLSFVENGRSQPSRELLLRLAEHLEMPLRERNRLFLAAGYAPAFSELPLDHADMTAARQAVHAVLDGHAPYPALAVDRGWTLVAANQPAQALMKSVDPSLLRAPNVLRISLHADGLASQIVNLAEWRHHVLARLRTEATKDPTLLPLLAELTALPGPKHLAHDERSGIVVPLLLRTSENQTLSLISTTTVFGTATDVTLAELTLETFFPADAATRSYFIKASEP